MTQEEFYNAANALVEGFNCYFVTAIHSLTRYSTSKIEKSAHTICYQFGDSMGPVCGNNDKFVIYTQSETTYYSPEESLEAAKQWLIENENHHLLKITQDEPVNT